MQKKTLILSLLLVLFIAGCTGSSGTQTNGKEILKITNLDSFPKNIVHPDETFILRATIKNVAQVPATFDVGTDGKDVLFDYCSSLYELTEFVILTGQNEEADTMVLDPHEEVIFQWTFKAPEEKEIGADMGLSNKCTFKTQVKYDFMARSTIILIRRAIIGLNGLKLKL